MLSTLAVHMHSSTLSYPAPNQIILKAIYYMQDHPSVASRTSIVLLEYINGLGHDLFHLEQDLELTGTFPPLATPCYNSAARTTVGRYNRQAIRLGVLNSTKPH